MALLALGQLLQVLLRRNLAQLRVDERLRVLQLLLHVAQVLRHDLHALAVLGQVLLALVELARLLLDLQVELLVVLAREERQGAELALVLVDLVHRVDGVLHRPVGRLHG